MSRLQTWASGSSAGVGAKLAGPSQVQRQVTCLPFADVSLDVDTGRTGKVKKGSGDKVRPWIPRECEADRQIPG